MISHPSIYINWIDSLAGRERFKLGVTKPFYWYLAPCDSGDYISYNDLILNIYDTPRIINHLIKNMSDVLILTC